MLKRDTDLGVQVRPYRESDEAEVLAVLRASLGDGPAGSRPPEFFRWKHFANPFGPSYMLVAEADGRIAGLRAFMRWRLHAGDALLRAVIAVDTATHPEYQGRGIFSRLTREALDALRGEVDFVFNTPNDKSLPGYLKMGWQVVGKVPVRVRVRRPLRLAAHVRTLRRPAEQPGTRPPIAAPPAGAGLAPSKALSLLLAEAESGDGRLSTPRDPSYLRWRYGDAPLLDYRAVRAQEGGHLQGLAIFRVRPRGALWESTVDELIVRPGDHATARRLLRYAARSARVDLLTCHFPVGSTAQVAAGWAGFIPSPAGITLAARHLREGIEPDPTQLSSWALSLGDLEVF